MLGALRIMHLVARYISLAAAIDFSLDAITGRFLEGGKGFGEVSRIAASQVDTPRGFR
jgi:hypothetical protein